jgi:hypothetical protein
MSENNSVEMHFGNPCVQRLPFQQAILLESIDLTKIVWRERVETNKMLKEARQLTYEKFIKVGME